MKILIVTPFLPYPRAPHAGGVSVYESIKRLSGDHDVYLLSRVEPSELSYVEDIRPLCKEIKLEIFKTPPSRAPLPIILSYIRLGMTANRLMKKDKFDLVQAEYIETGIALRSKGVPSIIVAHDVISKPAGRRLNSSVGLKERFVSLLVYKFTKTIERFISKKFDMVFVMSEIDRAFLLSLDKEIKAEVYPNLLRLEFRESECREREAGSLLFAGAMHRDVNVDAVLYFYREILPLIRQKSPGIKFYVVGNNPPDNLIRLAGRDENLIVTGFVEDMGDYYSKAAVFVSPLLVGGGIIVKNLQAMAFGLPVVTSSIGNEGIEATQGKDIFVADAPADFADKVLLLLNDADLRKNMGNNGREYAKKRFDDTVLMSRRIKVYKELCGR